MKDFASKKRVRDANKETNPSKKQKKEVLVSEKSNEILAQDIISPPFFISNFRDHHSIKDFEKILTLPFSRNADTKSLEELLNKLVTTHPSRRS